MNRCSVCIRDDIEAINADILAGKLTNVQLQEKYNLSCGTLNRHKTHIKQQVAAINEGNNEAADRQLGSAITNLTKLARRADAIYKRAEKTRNSQIQLKALKELRETVTVLSKVTGELTSQPQVIHNHLHISPEWLKLRSQILLALEPFPDARRAIIGILEQDNDD